MSKEPANPLNHKNQQQDQYQSFSHLQVDSQFAEFVHAELLPSSGLATEAFWQGVSDIVHTLAPVNKQLLNKRDTLQQTIDHWHKARKGQPINAAEYKTFLTDIGYLVPQGEPFEIDTQNIDPEIATLAGPQLVVPVMNARFALNACNARWGSLYDALYGTDTIEPLVTTIEPPVTESTGAAVKGYNPARGQKVINYGREFLDKTFPLKEGSFKAAQRFSIEHNELIITLASGHKTSLLNPSQFKGTNSAFIKSQYSTGALLLVNNGLHAEIVIDKTSAIGQTDAAGISDIILESALTTIMDCEDSVAAVDAEDKIQVYRNWLGLMAGTLEEPMVKNGKAFTRKMQLDRQYITPQQKPFSLPGRSLLFVRNVGHLMTSTVILDKDGNAIPEGILDGIFTSLAALADLKPAQWVNKNPNIKNSRTGSLYIVKPKMHGPEEVAFSDCLFAKIEQLLQLPKNTLKMGIMDEERRTSVNLIECIRAAKSRVVFINTGFLDRTGDEIHTSMQAGAFAPKAHIKSMPWINAYETSNVAAGLLCGLQGKAQIGKGMWAMPDNMAGMMAAKISQPKAGANTAWVPSPTAATLHAMHYHEVSVVSMQAQLAKTAAVDIDTILQIPLLDTQQTPLTPELIQQELENNAQGLLGYVVRWVEQGIGCSKVPDIHNTQLMEDRATLRISSQHIANWLHHNICSKQQVMEVLTAMAKVVDEQNSHDSQYTPMCPKLDESMAFKAAKDLIFKGLAQPSGYTEPLLHAYRAAYKKAVFI